MVVRNILGSILICSLLISCSRQEVSDAFGQFEADEITISAESSGKILQFDVEEGARLEAGTVVGFIDSVALNLKRRELEASVKSIQSQIMTLNAQADVYKEQLKNTDKDFKRLEALKQQDAATQKQIDDVEGQINTLKKQIDAVNVQKQSVYAEIETMETRIAQIEDQLDRTVIVNPVTGTVLSKYAEQYELASQGKPLYEIANMDELILRVFVSGAQLPAVRLGQSAEVIIDKDADSNQSFSGTVSWISSQAEFTPKMIQTKEERVTQMYAVKIRVSNPEGKIKIGMPGEVNFN